MPNLSRYPITFSITAEDHRIVEQALMIDPESSVVCICSAGDTPLNLLNLDPKQVNVIDINFPQICLAQLKSESMRHLNITEFHILMGIERNGELALEYYYKVRAYLPHSIQHFWDTHLYMIQNGLIWQGGVQKMFMFIAKALTILFGRQGIKDLKKLSSPQQAQLFYEQYLNTWRFQVISRLLINRFTYGIYYPKIGFNHLSDGMTPYQFSLSKIQYVLFNKSIIDNPYLHPFLFNKYPFLTNSYPPYLNPESYEKIKNRVDRLNFVKSDLYCYFQEVPDDTIGNFALCNVMDWMDQEGLKDLLREVIRVAKDKARVLIFSRHETLNVPLALEKNIQYKTKLSQNLIKLDRTGYYKSANVLEILK